MKQFDDKRSEAHQRWIDKVNAASTEHDIRYLGTNDPIIRGELVQIHIRTHNRLKAEYENEMAQIDQEEKDEIARLETEETTT